MLRWRLLAAAFILLPLFGLLYADYYHHGGSPGIWLLPIGALIVVGATSEFVEMLRDHDPGPHPWAAHLGSFTVFAAASVPVVWNWLGTYPPSCPIGELGWIVLAFAAAVMAVFVAEMRVYQAPGHSVTRIALTIAIIAYAGLLASFLVLLRGWHNNRIGMAALASMILVTKMSDTGAYFTGKLIGRHKLIPRISPGKTIEGTIGGFVAAIASAGLFFVTIGPRLFEELDQPLAVWQWSLYGALVAAAGMIGDLAESLIKRDLGRKDSSSWLPGLGGVLDIVDSLLFAAPVAYVCWVTGLLPSAGP